MFSYKKLIPAALFISLIIGASSILAVARVPARIYVIEFYGGSSIASGSYNGYRGDQWNTIFKIGGPNPSVPADNIYGPSYNFGFNYGQLRNNHMFYSVGFRYTKVEVDSLLIVRSSEVNLGTIALQSGHKENLYDITFDLNYFPFNVVRHSWSPYFGVGFKGGLMVFSQAGRDQVSGLEFASQTEIKFSSSLNFGLDLKLWSEKGNRSQVVISSSNSFDFWGGGNRPRYMNFGVGLKYYFRP